MQKYVLVTGATKGIGRAIVERFAAEGHHVAFNARQEAGVAALLADLRQRYPTQQFWAKAVDMSKKEDVLTFAEALKKEWNKLDVLVNNAGVFLPGTLLDGNDDNFERMIDTNLYSAFYITRAVVPSLMLPQQAGHIFNIASIASFMPYGVYSVSKFALLGYSKVLREELKSKGVRVTAVMPGATYTASWDGVDLPESRFMPAEDIASAVYDAWKLSDRTVIEELILRPQLGDI